MATYHCTHLSAPFVVKSFASLTSASVRSGFFEKTCTQPPVPQLSRWKPLACRRCSSSGVELLLDRDFFLVALEEERHREHVERLVQFGEADGGEERRLQRVDARPHLLDRGRLVALRAARDRPSA